MADADIDLYADDLEHEFNQDGDYNHDSNVDLYDDVITTPSEDHQPNDEQSQASSTGSHSPLHPRHHGKRVTLYVGNLTWWTTDQDVTDAIHTLGVNDIMEIKFYENRANGQSKGFCVVSLGSENSLRTVMDKLPKKELHGQNPVVTACNRHNLNHFEMQSRKGSHGMHSGNRHEGMNKNNSWDERRNRDRERDRDIRDGRERNMPPERARSRSNTTPAFQQQQRAPPGPPMHHPPPQGPPPQYPPGRSSNFSTNILIKLDEPSSHDTGRTPWMAGPPPQLHQMPPPPPASRPGGPPMPNPSAPPPPPGIQAPPPPRPGPPPPGSMRLPPPRGPLPPMGPRSVPPPDPRAPPPSQHDWDRMSVPHAPPPQHVGIPPQPGAPANRPPLPVQPPGQGMPPSIPPPAPHPPAPHINPAFFPPHTQNMPPGLPPTSQPADIYSRPPPMQFNDYRPVGDRGNDPSTPSISDAEFEEIMGRNRTVSSSAIARAVSDASAGDYASAIETLVTAISLIKQSKVANDERCKILISSLQDTLHGIESKSYGSSRSKERPRSRERERSRERSSRREKSSRRDRSRSRDREYRDRSRERDRYHDDRYRDKDRDRDHDRDRRSSRH